MPTGATPVEAHGEREVLGAAYLAVRHATRALCAPLAIEDYVIQSMGDVSPPKWHLAHTTWFFETFLLRPLVPAFEPYHAAYAFLFNSYYEALGPQFPRLQRGTLSRPTVEEVYRYRESVDSRMLDLIRTAPSSRYAEVASRTVLGLNHEQQHQELLVTDIKHIYWVNPLRPVYRQRKDDAGAVPRPPAWRELPAGVYEIGHEGGGFAFDNESPRHRVYLDAWRIAERPVTNGEFLDFVRAGGYRTPALWLSQGWQTARERNWQAPLYWEERDGVWWYMTLAGMKPVAADEPVCHVSYFEADAYARWAGARLPTEAEWEVAARRESVAGNFLDSGRLHPAPAPASERSGALQFYGDVWEWTQSAYCAYPGYRPAAGALGEYNGKFMCGQYVLRGGSCATPAGHVRPTYRNFFYPADRWQFTGIRLAA
jgi:ergothioneine biosynthesis protein EgtB